MNNCECQLAGFCQRHGVKKSTRMIELCKTDSAYWQAWQEGRGPLQNNAAKRHEPQQTAEYNHWCRLHYYPVVHAADWDARKAKRFYCGWQAAIPNSRGCGCREKWIAMQVECDFSTPAAFFESSVIGHNRVSESLGKPTISLAEAYAIWWKSI